MDLKTISTIIIIVIPFFLLTMLALVDASRKDFDTIGQKVFWMIIAFIPFVGFIIYLFFGFRKGKASKKIDSF